MLTYLNIASLLGKLVALMVTGLGDTTMKILESSVSQTKSPGNFQSLNTWSRHVLSLIPFVLHKTLPVVQRPPSVSASTTTMVQSANTHLAISNTFVNSAVNNTQGSNVADQTKARPVLDQQVATTIKFEVLLQELQGYDTALLQFLVQGFQYGFKLGCTQFDSFSVINNHPSVRKNPIVVCRKLNKELHLNRISGPYSFKPFDNFVCSPLGLVPKKTPGEFRIIHDLSFPEGNSVNEHISRENATVQYESIENVIQLIKKFGKVALMAKLDVEDGFRNIPIHPSDHHFLGFIWENQYYFDKCLPMGASSSCQLFEKLSTALQWIMLNKYKASGMSHLIDDFFFIGPASSEKCLSDVNNFQNLCQRLGVPLKDSKTVLPTTCLTIYGLEVDSIKMEVRLPEDKLYKLRQLLIQTVHRKKIQLKELQSLIGLLNFACQVAIPGRAFLRRL